MTPTILTILLSLATALCAISCILCDETQRRSGVYLAKPLSMLWILALAAQASPQTPALERNLIITGLVFSLAGDVLLMLPSDRFAAGLASFLVAHLLYIAAFASGVDAPSWLSLRPFLWLAVLLYLLLLPRLGALKLPVAAYMAAIVAMAWLATARWLESDEPRAALACAGALLFVVSDASLAWNRFRRPIPHAQTLVLGTYFPAQWLIALSLGAGTALFGAAAG